METLNRPLRFERKFFDKIWGGRALERALGIALPEGMRVGETWEVVDRDELDDQGSVVEKVVSVVRGGPLAGIDLEELVRDARGPLLGAVPPNARGRFPLLVKFIDACAHLSVQVHPDEAAAARIGGDAEAKTEAWYVLASEPGSALWVGLRDGVDADAFAHAARSADPGIVDMLARVEVRAGDCVFVPGGTVHAIGAGITLLEVQQNSDTTYRLHDWGRVGDDGKPREIHVEQALRCIDFDRAAPTPVRAESDAAGSNELVTSSAFAIVEHRLEGDAIECSLGDAPSVLVALDGDVELSGFDGAAERLGRGDVVLVPASVERVRARALGTRATLVELAARGGAA